MMSLKEQTLLTLMQFNLSIFFYASMFDVLFKKSLLPSGSKNILQCFA